MAEAKGSHVPTRAGWPCPGNEVLKVGKLTGRLFRLCESCGVVMLWDSVPQQAQERAGKGQGA